MTTSIYVNIQNCFSISQKNQMIVDKKTNESNSSDSDVD